MTEYFFIPSLIRRSSRAICTKNSSEDLRTLAHFNARNGVTVLLSFSISHKFCFEIPNFFANSVREIPSAWRIEPINRPKLRFCPNEEINRQIDSHTAH